MCILLTGVSVFHFFRGAAKAECFAGDKSQIQQYGLLSVRASDD